MYYLALDQKVGILGLQYSSGLDNKPRRTADLRSLVCVSIDGGYKGDVRKVSGRDPPRVKAKLTAKGPGASEGAQRDAGKKAEAEKLWQELFSDPQEWTDHRSDKLSLRFPDYKHKKHPEKALWLDSRWKPPWVEGKLATLPPGSIQRSTFSRNQLLSRYAQGGQDEKTMELFQQMQRDGETADGFTFFPVLKACTRLRLLEEGRRIHKMMQPGFETHPFLGSSLVDMYAKCGSIEEAEMVFSQMPTKDVVTWTAMIVGYVNCGNGQKALQLFGQMQALGVHPNHVTFVGVLNACASVAALEVGRRTHEEIVRRGYDLDLMLGNCLVDMYAKCGSIDEAEIVFNKMPTKDVVAWTAMIVGYVKCKKGQKALELFELMLRQGVNPNHVTFVGVLNACSSEAALEEGRRAHEDIIRRGYDLDMVLGNCLVDMYAKCGSIDEAKMVFDQLPRRDVVAWNALIAGYVNCGRGQKALELFDQMQGQGVDPDPVTFVSFLNACASVAAIEGGRRAHEEIIRRGYDRNVYVGTCLVDMYAKCGSITEAERVFNQMPTRDVVAWNAMIAGYGIHGHAREAIETFIQMCKFVEVDAITFTSLLCACSHGGLVDEGLEYFKSMSAVYKITPTMEHFACVVDLLGRAGRLDDAEHLIMSMPMDPDVGVWMILLGACRTYVNVEVGERCAKRALKLDPDNAAPYVMISNIYAAADKLDSKVELNSESLCRSEENTRAYLDQSGHPGALICERQ